MEDLINLQYAQKEIMEKFVINYKKDGKDRRTAVYYEKRLSDFENLWNEFKERHMKLLVMKYAAKNESDEENNYFDEDVFSSVESSYFSNFALINDRYKQEYPPRIFVNEEDSREKSPAKSSSGSYVKLPKITLERFSGDYRNWPTFHDLFKSLVHENHSLSPAQKLQYLKLHLVGESEHLLRHFQVTDDNYKAAWDLLRDRYDNKRVLVNTQLKVLLGQNSVVNESTNGVKGLLDTTTECLNALINIGVDTTGWDPLIVYLIVQKLPSETHQLWEQSVSRNKDLPSWEELKSFLEARFRTLEAISSKKQSNVGLQRNFIKPSKSTSQSFHISTTTTCVVCLGSHSIRQCPRFSSLNTTKRLEVVKMKGLCINCLGAGHISSKCPSQQRCYHCRKNHHTLLHRTSGESGVSGSAAYPESQSVNTSNDSRNVNNNNYHASIEPRTDADRNTNGETLSASTPAFIPSTIPSTSTNLNSFLVSRTPKEHILLATALVKIVSPSGQEQIARALVDQGSQTSFVTESIVQNLKLKKEPISANIHGVGQSQISRSNYRVNFKIKALKNENQIEVSSLVLKNLTHLLPTKTLNVHTWEHVKGLELADPQFYQPGKIDLLLGADVYSSIIMNGLIKGPKGSPVAQKTVLGWILSGEVKEGEPDSLVVNNFHVCTELNNSLKRFWELEEIPSTTTYSAEEQQCEELFLKTYKRLENGQYKVELPFRDENHHHYLGKSRSVAIARLLQLETTFQKNSTFKESYSKCLQEYLQLGHMKRVTTQEEDHKRTTNGITSIACSYLPHHGIVKESSTTTKLRVVFDASRATQSGISLNDMLLKGPVVQDELAALLLRWRKYKIVYTADIEKMYRQVWVKNEHTEYQRIVWRDSPELPIQDYKLLTVTFGTKPAPFLATRILKQLAIDEREKYPQASKVALTDFYVDDLISGADTTEAALEIQKQLIDLMKSGGFSLRKWSSNCEKLLESVPKENVETNTPFDFNRDKVVKTLGIYWHPHNDCFSYSLTIEDKTRIWTKRSILSEVSKLFDPLGWVTPIFIVAKIFIQKLWLSGLNWDEEISTELENEWLKFISKAQDISKISIPRWSHFSNTSVCVELHGFSDASIKAYAAVVYMCTINAEGKRHITLLTSKSRVAPIKTVSLPRLELCGATLLAKLLHYVKQNLKIENGVTVHAWTDSEIVLAWLKAHPSKWSTFVANRVSHIHDLLGQNIWSHVPSKENPADYASRGMSADELRNNRLWWNGPEWLGKTKIHWLNNKNPVTTDLEKRKVPVYHASIQPEDLDSRYSSLTKLLRVTALCRRFIRNAQNPPQGKQTGYLKYSEIQEALQIWLKKAQQQEFEEELKALKSKQPVSRKSRLAKLNPFLDPNGLLRVQGRLRHSDLSYDEKHPIILSDKGNLTRLLIEKVHKDTLHGGQQLMMNILRKRYWLLNARNVIRQHNHKCIPCYRQKATSQTQLMGDLPTARVRMSRPFAHTGIDYCGPFIMKTYKGRNPKTYKAYIALFICMSTKAIHLELVTDLSAEGFIAAFRRFSSRRGLCNQVYCDNGSNFVGAYRLLSKQHRQMADNINSEIAAILENEGIKFNFIPPASPHFGGLWESGVRSTKHHLKRVLGHTVLTYEEFSTILTQIEACLNSRPLCELSSDPQDLNPLTPAHFLIGDVLLTPPEPMLLEQKINRLDRWQFLQRIYQDFWKRWNAEYLCRLQQRPKWARKTENVKIGDLVIVKEENLPPCRWILARVIDTHPGKDELVRVVTLKSKETILKRPITKICLLPIYTRTNEEENRSDD